MSTLAVKKEKVLIISKSYPPDIDGVGDHSYQLAHRLNKEGYEVEIATATKKTSSDFKVYENDLSGFNCIGHLTKIIKTANPDFILFQYVPFSFNIKGLPIWLVLLFLNLFIRKYKILLFVHETFERRLLKKKHLLLKILQKGILKLLCKFSYLVLTTNNLYFNQLKTLTKNLKLARTPSNFEPIDSQYSKSKQIKNKVIVIFGNRDLRKSLLIFEELYKTDNEFTLRIIGKTDKNNLTLKNNSKLTAQIVVTGILTSKNLLNEIANAGVYLLPEYVGLKGDGGLNSKSGTTATGFMLGKTVISTKGDMTDSIFKDMHNCVLIDNNEPQIAAKKIITLFSDQNLKNYIEENARLLYLNHLAWSLTIAQIKNYKKIC